MGEFATDKYGLAIKCQDIKISSGFSTWKTRLRQAEKMKGIITICTYSLPCVNTAIELLSKIANRTTIIANSKFEKQAQRIQDALPDLKIILRPDTHAKLFLMSPDLVHNSSANFGESGWFENTDSMHNRQAYRYLMNNLNSYLVGDDIE